MKCAVVRVPTGSPSDTQALDEYVKAGRIVPEDVVAVMGKTEGNGCVNDFTRGYAVHALRDYFTRRIGDAASGISYVMSGGTEGVLSPHLTVISRSGSGRHRQPLQAGSRWRSAWRTRGIFSRRSSGGWRRWKRWQRPCAAP